MRLAVLALLAVAVGPLLVLAGFNPLAGYLTLNAGFVLGAVAFIASTVGLARRPTDRMARNRARRGFALSGAITATGVILAVVMFRYPTINDISTDLEDPPEFEAAGEAPANQGRDLSYAGAQVADAQRRAYPDLAPLTVPHAPAEAFRRAADAAGALGWRITRLDPARGRIEAEDQTRVFRFVDDVVVRVRPTPAGSVIDVRSKSRVGRGDLGKNAKRIRAFLQLVAPSA